MKKIIELKVEQLVECLLYKIRTDTPNLISGGLYNGEFGSLIFLSYYSKYKNDSNLETTIHCYVEKLLENLVKCVSSHTFCSGYSGVLYLFDFLKDENLLYIDYKESQSMIEDYIILSMERDISDNNYDFLHGVLGCGYYFLKNNNDNVIQCIIDFLFDISIFIEKKNTICWKSKIDGKGKKGYNIALSHGMASIILFLSCLIDKGIKNEKIYKLLHGGINYILSQEIDVNKFGSFFPSQSLENGDSISRSRLAWCYGDLGIAYSFWRAGKITSNAILEKKALDMFFYSTKRISVESSGVVDAGLCHGSTGIAMIFRRMYLNTGCDTYYEATNFWIEKTLNYACFNDGLAGYKTYIYPKWELDYSLLTGISGIGLMLLSYLLNDRQSWDKMFLL